MSGVWIVTGVAASGKTTVARLLAERFERGVHVEGDAIREMVRRGRTEMGPEADAEALAQLALRYRGAAAVAHVYAAAGFEVVLDDVMVGTMLQTVLGLVDDRPRRLVVLAPDQVTVAARDAGRAKDGYRSFTVAQLDAVLRSDTPRLGLWLDSTGQTPEQTVDEILAREPEAIV